MHALTLMIVGTIISLVVNAVCVGSVSLGLAIAIIPAIAILGALSAPPAKPAKRYNRFTN